MAAPSSTSLYDTLRSQSAALESPKAEVGSKDSLFVQFYNVNYATRRNKDEPMTQILTGVTGYAKPGSILCIMGPSGAGKTTLLNIIARKIQAEGDLLINNETVSNQDFKRIAAYVPQEDILMGSMSAREVLTFTADLLLPQNLTFEEKAAKVQAILNSLGLATCADTPIGYVGTSATHSGFKRGISGGERKRVSIGLELITNPRVIILDEPTSGLDSFSAKVVVSGLKTLAKQGRTVLTTIHQPSIEIFVQFDDLLILAEGQTIFFGETQKSFDYFGRAGYPCPPHTNPASYFLKILYTKTTGASSSHEHVKDGVVRIDLDVENDLANVDKSQALQLIDHWKSSPESVGSDKKFPVQGSVNANEEQLIAPSWKQIWWVFLRSIKNNFREPLMTKMRIGQNIFVALVAGLIYLQRGHDQIALHDRAAALFFLVLGQVFGSMNGPMFLFPAERAIFMREHSSGLYSTLNYYVGRCLSDIPVSIVSPLVFSSIVYPMIDFNRGGEHWFIFFLVVTIIGITAASLGILLGCAITNFSLLFVIQPAIMFPVILFGGLYVNLDTVPVFLSWLEEVSFMKFAYRAAMVNEFKGVDFYCKPDQYVTVDMSCRGTNMTHSDAPLLRCPVTSGTQYLKQFSMDGHEIWADLITVGSFAIAFYILSFAFLKYNRRKEDV